MWRRNPFVSLAFFLVTLIPGISFSQVSLPNPIVFVGQVKTPTNFADVLGAFDSQSTAMANAPRGGGLFIRYPDGTVRDLTKAAGYGSNNTDGFQDSKCIAVRNPSVHWGGSKVIFSMVQGCPAFQYNGISVNWQLYEITGLGQNQTPIISKVPNQPQGFNNIMPTYGSDDLIFFVSDRTRNGALHLYPRRDEYENIPTNTGLWRLNPQSGELLHLVDSPSGISGQPSVDSFGRVIFANWDHLQRDERIDSLGGYGLNFESEAPDAKVVPNIGQFPIDYFPEPRILERVTDPNLKAFDFNHFFPWMLNQDGTNLETLNHIGRHELTAYFDKTFLDDPNLVTYNLGDEVLRSDFNSNLVRLRNDMLSISEDPNHPGTYLAMNSASSLVHASGQIVSITGGPSLNADQMRVTPITHYDTGIYSPTINNQNVGQFRNPIFLSNGTLVAARSSYIGYDFDSGTPSMPHSQFDFRLMTMKQDGAGLYVPDQFLTSGINVNLNWWDPDHQIFYQDRLWEVEPVELRARPRPQLTHALSLSQPEQNVFNRVGLDPNSVSQYLANNQLALIISRNITTRDKADRQQPFNLRVAGTSTQTISASGKIYDVDKLQIFAGRDIRAHGPATAPNPGRRTLPAPMGSEVDAFNPAQSAGGVVKIGLDGSMAAVVPARRALTWQLQDPNGKQVVNERYWLTFQPGEIRVCASCHGVNTADQIGAGVPQNEPKALEDLLNFLRSSVIGGVTPAPSATKSVTPNPTVTRTPTPANSATPIATKLPTPTATSTRTATPTANSSQTATPLPTILPTSAPTPRVAIDNVAPSAPRNLTGRTLSKTAIALAWRAASDNVGVVEYRIYRDSVYIGKTSGVIFRYTDSGLNRRTIYNYNVRAADSAGNLSVSSNIIRIRTAR